MRKIFVILICLALICSFASCENNVKFSETENKTIVARDGTEYTFVGFEGMVACFGEWKFIGHVKGEQKSFTHLTESIQTGMYSVMGSDDVLVRYFPNNEFPGIYVKSELLDMEVSLDRCIRFVLLKYSDFYNKDAVIPQKGVSECQQFLSEIKSGQTAEEAGLYDLLKQSDESDGSYKACYKYGYVCGVIQEELNLVIPLKVWSFDDKAYSIEIDGVEYVLPEEWINKLIVE